MCAPFTASCCACGVAVWPVDINYHRPCCPTLAIHDREFHSDHALAMQMILILKLIAPPFCEYVSSLWSSRTCTSPSSCTHSRIEYHKEGRVRKANWMLSMKRYYVLSTLVTEGTWIYLWIGKWSSIEFLSARFGGSGDGGVCFCHPVAVSDRRKLGKAKTRCAITRSGAKTNQYHRPGDAIGACKFLLVGYHWSNHYSNSTHLP